MGSGYIEYKLKTSVNIESLISFLFYDAAKDYAFSGERHYFWEMVYVDGGAIWVSRGDEEFLLEEGSLVIHPPEEFHNIRCDGERSARFFIVTFVADCDDLLELRDKYHVMDKEQTYLLKQLYTYGDLAFQSCGIVDGVMRLEKRIEGNYGAEQFVKLYLEALLLSVIVGEKDRQLYHMGEVAQTPEGILHEQMDRLKYYMVEHLNEPLTLDVVESAIGMSRRKIQYVIKEAFGMTFTKYVRYMRVARAKVLLRAGTLTITEIADCVGYSSIHYFSNQFKREVGLTPSDYAKSLKLEAHGLTFDKKS